MLERRRRFIINLGSSTYQEAHYCSYKSSAIAGIVTDVSSGKWDILTSVVIYVSKPQQLFLYSTKLIEAFYINLPYNGSIDFIFILELLFSNFIKFPLHLCYTIVK